MKDWEAIRERYLRDGLPACLGGLAANPGRIRSFAAQDGSQEVVPSLIEESERLIEWTAGEMEVHSAAELVSLQVLLARWRVRWPRIRDHAGARGRVAEDAAVWSERVLEMSGLLR